MLLKWKMCWASKIVTGQVEISIHLSCGQVGKINLCRRALQNNIILHNVDNKPSFTMLGKGKHVLMFTDWSNAQQSLHVSKDRHRSINS